MPKGIAKKKNNKKCQTGRRRVELVSVWQRFRDRSCGRRQGFFYFTTWSMETPQVLLVQFSVDANIHVKKGDPLRPKNQTSTRKVYVTLWPPETPSHCVKCLVPRTCVTFGKCAQKIHLLFGTKIPPLRSYVLTFVVLLLRRSKRPWAMLPPSSLI